jgi:hypothetical protein
MLSSANIPCSNAVFTVSSQIPAGDPRCADSWLGCGMGNVKEIPFNLSHLSQLQAFFLVADDLMDGSITRRGQPCWYKRVCFGEKLLFLVSSFSFSRFKSRIQFKRIVIFRNCFCFALGNFQNITIS